MIMKNRDAIVWKDGTITYKDELGNIKTSSIEMVKEIRFHLDAYNDGSIDSSELIQAIEEIVYN